MTVGEVTEISRISPNYDEKDSHYPYLTNRFQHICFVGFGANCSPEELRLIHMQGKEAKA